MSLAHLSTVSLGVALLGCSAPATMSSLPRSAASSFGERGDQGGKRVAVEAIPAELAELAELAEPVLAAHSASHDRTGAAHAVRDVERTTLLLRGGLHSPMPGGYMAGYQADTGLDIAGFRLPVYAVAAGKLDYSEPGHTAWAGSDDKAVRLALDEPIPYEGRRITHVWYAHLHELTYFQEEGASQRIQVVAGERLGTSGIANGSPHLHLGFLLDNRVNQRWGTYLLEGEIREVLGDYRAKERLPEEPAGASPRRLVRRAGTPSESTTP